MFIVAQYRRNFCLYSNPCLVGGVHIVFYLVGQCLSSGSLAFDVAVDFLSQRVVVLFGGLGRCVYDDDTCKEMRAAGYKVTLDGRAWPPRERKEKKA